MFPTAGAPPVFAADIPRRDAIVKAFKVLAVSLEFPTAAHLGCSARLVSVWCAIYINNFHFRSVDLSQERDAMGDDEYHPISKTGTNLSEAGGIGYTVIDSLDTMMLMGLDDELARARSWIQQNLTFERDAEFNTFEVIPRSLSHG